MNGDGVGPAPERGEVGTAAYAGLGPRAIARLIDALVVAVPLGVVIAVLPGVDPGGFASSVASALVGFAYFVVMETSRGATVGKRLLGLSVRDAGGGATVSTQASMTRNAWLLLGVLNGVPLIGWLAGLVSLAIVIAIMVTISTDSRHRGVHDQLAATMVVSGPRVAS